MGGVLMSFDIMSFLMGKAAGGGGGGGAKTLFSSGWIKEFGNYTEVDGNNVNMKTGGTDHGIYISPPSNVRNKNLFVAEDVLVIAIEVKSVTGRIGAYLSNSSSGTVTSANNVFTIPNPGTKSTCYATAPGKDVLTFTASGSCYLVLNPSKASDGSSGANYTADVEITGMSYNGNLIFGSVTPLNA